MAESGASGASAGHLETGAAAVAGHMQRTSPPCLPGDLAHEREAKAGAAALALAAQAGGRGA